MFIQLCTGLNVAKGTACRQAKDADGKFCLGKDATIRQPSANHIYV